MKHLRYHIALSIALLVLLITLGVSYAWYVNGKLSYSPIIQSEDIEGINLYLYRGNDYDFNGSLDSRNIDEDYDLNDANVISQLNKDLNKIFFSIEDINDRITGIMDNNIATYRLRIVNDTDKEYYINPYFIFKTEGTISIYNSILFRLRDINIYNHTFLDKDSNFIDYIGGENHFTTTTENEITTGSFYEIKIGTNEGEYNGLYDTYGNPIKLITNGYTYYRLTYDENNVFTGIYENDNAEIFEGKINLSEFYNATLYYADGSDVSSYSYGMESVYDTKYVDSDYLYRMEYNYINQGSRSFKINDIGENITYDTNLYYPSNRYDLNTNLSLLMYNEKIRTNEIIIDSFSEYYIDYHFVVDSNLSSLNSAIALFAQAHNIDTQELKTKDLASCNDFEIAYKNMSNKISEMIQYSEIKQPNFKIEHFCFDMILINNHSSYVKKRGRIGDNS